MRTPMPASVPPATPTPTASGTRTRSPRRALAFDVLVAAAAALELLTWYGALDRASALVCPPALLALLLRRRFPVPVLLATLPSMATGHLWIAPMIALFTVASRTTRTPLVVAATAALFAATMWSGYSADTSGMAWGDHLFTVEVALMFSVGPAGLGLLARTRFELRARLRELTASQEHGRRLEAERAVARERARMAREMHDTVSYHLGIIATQSGALWATAPDKTVRQDAETIRRHSAAGLAELREVVGVLRRAAGADDGDTARLHHLPALVRDARLDAVLDLDATLPDGRACAPAVERAAYRTVQEALTNARKHAPGAPVTVTVRPSVQGDTLIVEVRNDAPPGDPAAPQGTTLATGDGYGLTGLKERTALVDGTLRAGPTPDGGFAVRAELPLTPPPAAPATAPAPAAPAPARQPQPRSARDRTIPSQ